MGPVGLGDANGCAFGLEESRSMIEMRKSFRERCDGARSLAGVQHESARPLRLAGALGNRET